MDIGLKGMGRKKDYYSTEDITIPVLNTRPLKSTINMLGRALREKVKEIQDNTIVTKDRFETYLKLLKIDKGEEVTNFIYQVNTIVRESKKVQ